MNGHPTPLSGAVALSRLSRPGDLPPGEGSLRSRGVLRVVVARRRLCRAAGPGASPHARLARQCEEWSGERRPEGAALNKYGKSNHEARRAVTFAVGR
jgi:hypothetical protein